MVAIGAKGRGRKVDDFILCFRNALSLSHFLFPHAFNAYVCGMRCKKLKVGKGVSV